MKITTIKLKDFRNHLETEIDLAPLTIIKGRNNSGKTSVRHAIEVALTGRAEFTDRGGRGLSDAIRVGQKAGVVELDVERIGAIARTIKASGSTLQVADWTGTATAQQDLLYSKLDADADLISALLNVSSFISLTPREQKDMLFKIARPEISIQQLMVAVNDWAEKQGAGNLLDELRSLIQIPETVGPDWLDQAHKLIVEARRQAKKDRDQLAGRVEGMAEAPQDLPDLDQLPELEKQISTLEAEREKLGEKIATVEAAEARRVSLAEREQNIKNSIEALSLPVEDSGEDPEELKAALKKLAARLDEARQASYEAQGEIKALDVAVPQLKKAGNDCPLGPGVVPCPLTPSDRKALIKDLNAQRKKLVTTHERAMKDAAAIETQKEELAERIWAAEQAEKNAERLETMEKELESVQAELATLPEPIGIDLARSEISTLDERIRNGHELSAKMKVAAEAQERAQTAKEKAAEASARVARLEALAVLLGPQGIKARLLSETMGAVIERAAENLSILTGGAYELDVESDPDFHLTVNGEYLRQLSTSERMRVGIACAEALAHASGLRLLVIDDLEILDLGNRGLLSEWLRGRMADHDTILVLFTAEEAQDPGVEGVATYWVEDGKVERIGAMANA